MNHRVRDFLIASLSVVALPATPALAANCGEGLGLWHAQPGFGVDFGSPIGILGVWRPGVGDVIRPIPELPAAHLACPPGVTCRVNNPNDGRSIIDFERHTISNDLYYALAFADVEKYEILLTNLADETALGTQLTIHSLLQNHMVDFETFTEGNQRRWAALFQEGSANQQLDLDISGTDLKSRVEGNPPPGRLPHLVDFEVLTSSFGPARYAALFDDAEGRQRFFGNLTAEDFHAKVHEQRLDDFILKDLETWDDSSTGSLKFAALFEPSVGDDHLWIMACGRNNFECRDPKFIDIVGDYLVSKTVKLPDIKPSLRLADIEVPRGNSEIGTGSFGEGAEGAKTRQVRERETALFDLPIHQVPPTCTHSGVLHDAGTNGPP
jgi:hypothetical protein